MENVVNFAASIIAKMFLAGAKQEHIENALGAMHDGMVKNGLDANQYSLSAFIADVKSKITA